MPINIYILLQGLFFLEYKSNPDLLFITAPHITGPGFKGHDYRMGNPEDKDKLMKIPLHTVLDWKDKLSGGAQKEFPRDMLRFSKTEAGTGDITDNPQQFAYRIILQYPIEIHPLRRGPTAEFHPSGSVWTSIQNQSKLRYIPLMTCLKYRGESDPSGSDTNRCHFYAESDCAENLNDVNSAYSQCGKPFFSTGFDLKMVKYANNPVTPLPPAKDDPGLTDLRNRGEDDEYSLSEFFAKASGIKCPPPPPMEGINVANCAHFAVLNS